jgi:hypothetical protein
MSCFQLIPAKGLQGSLMLSGACKKTFLKCFCYLLHCSFNYTHRSFYFWILMELINLSSWGSSDSFKFNLS